MKIALWSTALAFDQVSITHRRLPPARFQWLRPGDADAAVLMVTDENAEMRVRFARETAGDTRPKVLWRQEASWIMPAGYDGGNFDLVLSHDAMDEGAVYLPFVGTWLQEPLDLEKEFLVSMVASAKNVPGVDGYRMRALAAQFFGAQWPHGYGNRFHRPVEDKAEGLCPYYFSVAIESESYPWYHSEKLFDCFAAKAVPLYWGCQDLSRLDEWGYDVSGILPWTTPEELAHLVGSLSVERYESMRAAIHANYERTKELYCTEVALEKVLKEHLCLDSAS